MQIDREVIGLVYEFDDELEEFLPTNTNFVIAQGSTGEFLSSGRGRGSSQKGSEAISNKKLGWSL